MCWIWTEASHPGVTFAKRMNLCEKGATFWRAGEISVACEVEVSAQSHPWCPLEPQALQKHYRFGTLMAIRSELLKSISSLLFLMQIDRGHKELTVRSERLSSNAKPSDFQRCDA